MVGEPFVQVKAVPSSGKCEDLDTSKHKHVLCKGRVFGVGVEEEVAARDEHCCYGNDLEDSLNV